MVEISKDELLNDRPDEVMAEEEDNEEFWTPGPLELLKIRESLLQKSLIFTKYKKIEQLKEASQDFTKTLLYRRRINQELKKTELIGSKIVSNRAVSKVKFSKKNPSRIAIGSWNGDLKILNINTLEPDTTIDNPIKTYENQNNNKVTGIDWYPKDSSSITLASSSSNEVSIWNNDKTPISTLTGHQGRVINTVFHPFGDYLASSSYDKTWRFWDLTKSKELYLQEGHSKEIHALGFQPNGGLIASGGLDGIARIWDLRVGKEIMTLFNHIKDITSLDWSDNGFQLVTGSKDCTIKIWDLRSTPKKLNKTEFHDYLFVNDPIHTIPAHLKLVSDLKFFHAGKNMANYLQNDLSVNPSSKFLISSSFDGSLRIWSADNWIHLKTLKGHTDDKIMSCDINSLGDTLISGGWDRSIKVWSPNDIF